MIYEVLTLNSNGLWLSNGHEITHEMTVKAFSKNLRKTAEGWKIIIDRESKDVVVEDTPFFVTRIETIANGIRLHLNDETSEMLSPKSLKYSPDRLVCSLQRGEEAKFIGSAYFELLNQIDEDAEGYFLKVADETIRVHPSKKAH